MVETVDVLVIGAGPAGLMAAEVASKSGARVVVVDQMPSPARKFLMAGKSGLNVTKMEPLESFVGTYGSEPLAPFVSDFGSEAVRDWVEGLGQETFEGSTKRLFPSVMKASPLLRAWLARLEQQGVRLHRRWRFDGWKGSALQFDTPQGQVFLMPKATVLAMGGASWRRLGSDGAWAGLPELEGLCAPFAPSNTGLMVNWSAHMVPLYGKPIKAVAWSSGEKVSRGEAIISERGLEGGGIYPLIPELREGAALHVDLMPDVPLEAVRLRCEKGGKSVAKLLKGGLRLSPEKISLFNEFGRNDTRPIAERIKALCVPHAGPRPMDEAISTAGGLRFEALTQDLMLRSRPGLFACGEMLDWDAPTGGYLLTACFATGKAAGYGASQYAANLAKIIS